ncbi:MAG: hypothetical protein LBT49_04870 [Prevotellaceae bacterium]|jgi:hypothetical protein|nr:hypothetical protein [Prevotellaceae bacterium]
MSGKDFIPSKDQTFLEWLLNLLNYIIAGGLARFGLPDAPFNKLKEEAADFEAKFKLAEAPTTRTKLTVEAKTIARKLAEKDTRAFVREFLVNNSLVSDVDRDGMGLPIHKTTRSPSKVATSYPVGRADTSMLRQITLYFADQHAEDSARAKPDGQRGAVIRYVKRHVGDPVPVNISELVNSVFDTHSPYLFRFEGAESGLVFYFALSWENTRGEQGPWSPILSAIIP